MGTFLALSSIIGKTEEETLDALNKYTMLSNGYIVQDNTIDLNMENCCVVKSEKSNTSVVYPSNFLEWDESSQFLSKELNTTVFSFHIHDGDLWMYILYHNGEVVDQFNPIPDYWDDDLSEGEINDYKGDVDVIAKHVSYVEVEDIQNYLVRWDLDVEEEVRAYATDEYVQEDWQLIDFMKKLELPFPIDDDWNAIGTTYNMSLKSSSYSDTPTASQVETSKSWWKFW